MNSSDNSQFNLQQFVDRQKRDAERLSMAAWGVGANHHWFRILPREQQVNKVHEWVDEALEQAAERRAKKSGHAGELLVTQIFRHN